VLFFQREARDFPGKTQLGTVERYDPGAVLLASAGAFTIPAQALSDSNYISKPESLLTNAALRLTSRCATFKAAVLARAVFTFERDVGVQAPELPVVVEWVEGGVVGGGVGWKWEWR